MRVKKIIKNIYKNILNQLPYVKTLHKLNSYSKFPEGHYYSPVVSIPDIKRRQDQIWKKDRDEEISGISLNLLQQLQLIEELKILYKTLPDFNRQDLRYTYQNDYYSYTDGIFLNLMIRKFKPSRIIEIGSGYSSANIMDTNELFFENKISVTFIEPFPEARLYNLMKEEDEKINIVIQKDVQNIDLNIFKNLQKDDILFIDSTHVVKTGSDINNILFEILPLLDKGVIVHIHDIYYPFEYPKHWVFNGFNWNETYFVKSFLIYNDSFKIILFTDYLHTHQPLLFKDFPLAGKGSGNSLWLEKI